MIKSYKIIVLIMLVSFLISGCKAAPVPSDMIKAPESMEQSKSGNELNNIVVKLLPQNAVLIEPKNPKGTKAVQGIDIDKDGKEEILATYRINGEKLEVIAALYKEVSGEWKEQWKLASPGYEFDWVTSANLTGSELKDLVIGVDSTGGSLTTLGVKFFTLETGKPVEIYSTLYRDMNIIHPNSETDANGRDELVLWFKPGILGATVGAYKFELINNEYILVPDGEYNKYLKINILPQYEEKLGKLSILRDSWLYYYYYADIMLMLDNPGAAMSAVEKGLDKSESNYGSQRSKLLLLRAKAFDKLDNGKKAVEVLETALIESAKIEDKVLIPGYEALIYLELGNIYAELGNSTESRLYYKKALDAGKLVCNENSYKYMLESIDTKFPSHYIKAEFIEKDFYVKFIYSIEKIVNNSL